jgi:hypothetical protein
MMETMESERSTTLSMEINIPIEKLQKKSLFVATPMYGGQCAGIFTKATNDLSALAMHYKIPLKYYYLFNESLITRARNYCVDEFLRSDCTHMMFIDSDIGFNPNDVITMLALQDEEDPECPYDILCGPYPKKCISWEKIAAAVNKGAADEDPEVLGKFVGDYVFNPAHGKNEIKISEPAEVLEGGTGFMMFKRATLEKFQEAYKNMYYKPDHVRTQHFDGSREILAFFDAVIDDKQLFMKEELDAFMKENPKAKKKDILEFVGDKTKSALGKTYSNRYLSEDYMFCQWARSIGLGIWLCPWMELQHIGSFVFGGSLKDLAAVGQPATADPSKVGKNKTM